MSDRNSVVEDEANTIDGVAFEVKPPEDRPLETKPPTTRKEKMSHLAVRVNQAKEATSNAIARAKEDATTLVAFEKLTEENQQRAIAGAAAFDLHACDSKTRDNKISAFGSEPAQKIVAVADAVLAKTKMSELSETTDTIGAFVVDIDKVNIDAPEEPKTGWQKFVHSIVQPFKKWLKGMETVLSNLKRSEAKIVEASNRMLERAGWFGTAAELYEKQSPVAFLNAAIMEKVVEREEKILELYEGIFKDDGAFKQELESRLERRQKDPEDMDNLVISTLMEDVVKVYDVDPNGFHNKLREQQHLVDRLRGKTMDLHSLAAFTVYMQPAMKMGEDAAITARDACNDIVMHVMPQIKAVVASIINMRDVKATQDSANAVREVGSRMIAKLAENVGESVESIKSAYSSRELAAQSIHESAIKIAEYMRDYHKIHDEIRQMYGSVLESYGSVGEIIRRAALEDGQSYTDTNSSDTKLLGK